MASAAPQRFVGCSKRPASVVLDELAAKGLVNRASLWEKIERLAALTCIALEPDLALRFNSSRLPATTEGASTSSRPSHSSQSSRPHTAAAAPLPASPPVAPPSPRSLAEAAAPGFVGEPAVGTRQGASERPAASNVGKTEPTEPTVSSSESTAALAAHALDQHPRGTQGTQGADAAPRCRVAPSTVAAAAGIHGRAAALRAARAAQVCGLRPSSLRSTAMSSVEC